MNHDLGVPEIPFRTSSICAGSRDWNMSRRMQVSVRSEVGGGLAEPTERARRGGDPETDDAFIIRRSRPNEEYTCSLRKYVIARSVTQGARLIIWLFSQMRAEIAKDAGGGRDERLAGVGHIDAQDVSCVWFILRRSDCPLLHPVERSRMHVLVYKRYFE